MIKPDPETGKPEEPTEDPKAVGREEQEEQEEQGETKTGNDPMNPRLRENEGNVEEESKTGITEGQEETQSTTIEGQDGLVENLNFIVSINNTQQTFILSKDGNVKDVKDYSFFYIWSSIIKTETKTDINILFNISKDDKNYENFTETITIQPATDITDLSLNLYFNNNINALETGKAKNIYLFNKNESSTNSKPYFSKFTIDKNNKASEINFIASTNSDTNLDINSELKTLNITADKNYKTILNITETVEQLNLKGGNVELKQHTRNNFNSVIPTTFKNLPNSKGENLIFNLNVDKETILTINEEGENIPILSIGANHNITYEDSDNSVKVKDCSFIFKGKFKNNKNVIIFISCTSYQADYRLMLNALTISNNKFYSLDSTNGKAETYANHITKLNKVYVDIDSELINCNLYIGCHLLREKNFIISGTSFTADYTDLTINDLEIKVKYVKTLICGLMTSYLIYGKDDNINYNIKSAYATETINQPNTLNIKNINIYDSEADIFRVGGVYYNHDVNRDEEYKNLTFGNVKISNCKNQKNETSIFSAIHRYPDVKNLSFANNYKINFDNTIIENCQFNEDLLVLHGFKNTNRDKSKYKPGFIRCYNVYSDYIDNKIYLPFYYDNLGFTKFEYIINKQNTLKTQNIYLKGPKDFKDFSMYFELMKGNYKFYLGNNYDLEDDKNMFSLSGVILKIPNYKALVKDKQTNPKIDYDIGNLTAEQIIKLRKDIKDKSKFIIMFDKNIKVDILNILKLLAILLLLSINDKAFADILFIIIFKYYKQLKNIYYFLPDKSYQFIEIIIKYIVSKNYLM